MTHLATREEVWKNIEDYKGLYQVSNLGRVKSLNWNKVDGRRHKGRVLSPAPEKDGYLFVTLHKNRKQKTLRVHRLVAEAFIPNPDNLPQVNHKDEDKTNNDMDNLEWCTSKENINYGSRTIRAIKSSNYIERSKNMDYTTVVAHTDYKARSAKTDYTHVREATRKPVYAYKLRIDGSREERILFDTVKEAGRYIGVTPQSLTPVLNGKRSHSKGWFVEYAKKEKNIERFYGYKIDGGGKKGIGILFLSAEFASKYTGCKKKSIYLVLRGKAHTTNNWIFSYTK